MKYIGLPLLLLALAADYPTPPPATYDTLEVVYLRTVDGDTFWASIEGREFKVRLANVEAPELREGTAAAFDAASALAHRLEDAQADAGHVTLWVSWDDVADRYGRLVARLDPPEGI